MDQNEGIKVHPLRYKRSGWKYDRSVLAKPEFCEWAEQELRMFINENDNEVTPPILWETTKAYIRV